MDNAVTAFQMGVVMHVAHHRCCQLLVGMGVVKVAVVVGVQVLGRAVVRMVSVENK